MDYNTTVIESQPDWLTVSVHSREKTENWRHQALRWQAAEVLLGNKMRPFRLNGYLGSQVGRVRWGERENAGLIQLSGDLARQHFDYLYPSRDSLTRLDLAVTVRTKRHEGLLGQNTFWQACDFHAAHPTSALPSCHQDADGGWTTYVGHRESDYYLRVYDKMAESEARNDDDGADHYQNCWRWELEVKGVMAPSVAKAYSEASNRPEWLADYVAEWAWAHGITPAWQVVEPGKLLPGFRRRSDRASRLDWLHKQVRPTIAWLLASGDRTEVLERLGLPDLPADDEATQG